MEWARLGDNTDSRVLERIHVSLTQKRPACSMLGAQESSGRPHPGSSVASSTQLLSGLQSGGPSLLRKFFLGPGTEASQ